MRSWMTHDDCETRSQFNNDDDAFASARRSPVCRYSDQTNTQCIAEKFCAGICCTFRNFSDAKQVI